MTDQLTEEPMGATFVDQTSEAALADLGQIRIRLAGVVRALETAGGEYAKAWRMLLAGEACIDHSVAALTAARNARHQTWSERQHTAIDFLELRAQGSGRRFKVERDRRTADGRRYRGLPDTGASFTFTIERTAALNGGKYGRIVQVRELDFDRTAHTMALQELHGAFLDGAIAELEADPQSAITDPRTETEGLGLRLHLEDDNAGN